MFKKKKSFPRSPERRGEGIKRGKKMTWKKKFLLLSLSWFHAPSHRRMLFEKWRWMGCRKWKTGKKRSERRERRLCVCDKEKAFTNLIPPPLKD